MIRAISASNIEREGRKASRRRGFRDPVDRSSSEEALSAFVPARG
jgi:hypothetical protein